MKMVLIYTNHKLSILKCDIIPEKRGATIYDSISDTQSFQGRGLSYSNVIFMFLFIDLSEWKRKMENT